MPGTEQVLSKYTRGGAGDGTGLATGRGTAGACAPRGGPSSGPRRSLSPSGDRYWVFKDNNVEEGYPRPVSDFGLPPGGVDAAFTWAHNDKTYFFKDELYWRFDEHTRRMDPGHPARSPPWRGLPRTLDDAMRWSDGKSPAASVSLLAERGSERARWEPACAPVCPRAFALAPHPADTARSPTSGPCGAAPPGRGENTSPPHRGC